jgi:hypothetical protein
MFDNSVMYEVEGYSRQTRTVLKKVFPRIALWKTRVPNVNPNSQLAWEGEHEIKKKSKR